MPHVYALSRIACDPLARQQRGYCAQLCVCVFLTFVIIKTHTGRHTNKILTGKKGINTLQSSRGSGTEMDCFAMCPLQNRVCYFPPRQEDAQMEKTQLRLKHFLSVSHSIIIIPK